MSIMILKKLLYGMMGVALLSSCYDEDALTPGDRVIESRFEFPQGNDEWDKDLQDIYDEFGIYVIYKNYTEDDFDRSWNGGGGGAQAHYSGFDVKEEHVVDAINFIKNHMFAYLNRDVVQQALPPYLYLAYDLAARMELMPGYITKSGPNISFSGMDYWAIGWGRVLEYAGGLVQIEQDPPSTATVFRSYRGEFMQVLLRRAVERGNVVMPTGFGRNFDYKTQVVTGAPNEGDPNYYMTRGFPGKMGFEAFNLNPLTTINGMNPQECFICYLHMCLFYTKEQFDTQFATKFRVLAETRQQVVDYMKDTYKIDLEAIAQGPEIIQ